MRDSLPHSSMRRGSCSESWSYSACTCNSSMRISCSRYSCASSLADRRCRQMAAPVPKGSQAGDPVAHTRGIHHQMKTKRTATMTTDRLTRRRRLTPRSLPPPCLCLLDPRPHRSRPRSASRRTRNSCTRSRAAAVSSVSVIRSSTTAISLAFILATATAAAAVVVRSLLTPSRLRNGHAMPSADSCCTPTASRCHRRIIQRHPPSTLQLLPCPLLLSPARSTPSRCPCL